jgi:hypothetical protein
MSDITHYTQRPDVQKFYTVQETADLLDTSCDEVRRIVLYYKVKHETVRTKQSKAIMLDYDAYRLVKDIHEEKEQRRKEAAERAVIKRQKAEEENGADDASVHPLVKDKRFLKLSFFPDVVPECFKECEECTH